MTLKELWDLNWQLDIEISKRLWWVYVIFVVAYIGMFIYKLKKN